MTVPLLHPRSLLVALAAIAGMLSAGGEAAACAAKPASKTTRACCAIRPATDCGCCGDRAPEAAPRAFRQDVVLPSLGVIRLEAGAPASHCECRGEEPAAPSDRQTQRPSEGRPDLERGESAGLLVDPIPPDPSLSKPVASTASPPKAPLYLRTSRLLI